MLKFFRKVRRGLLAENKFSRYMVYAIGEIVLVVIGILIALSINNWNEANKDRKIEKNYLSGIKKELIADTTAISYRLLKPYEEKIDILKAAREFHNGKYAISDTLKFVEKVAGIKGGWDFIWTLNTNVYNELESTGNLRKIRATDLRQELSKYYSRLAMVQKISDKYESGLRAFINANLFYDSEAEAYENEQEKKQFLAKLKENKFYEVCNLELLHIQVMHYWALQMKERGTEILKMINEQTT